jgi:hypothetical protein
MFHVKLYGLIIAWVAIVHAWQHPQRTNSPIRWSMQLSNKFESTSLPKMATNFGKMVICTAWIGSCVNIVASPAIAAPFPAFTNVPVAKLFAEAEEAIESTQSSYKALQKEWADSKKVLQSINDDLSFAKKQLGEVESDLIKLEVKALQLFEIDKTGIEGISL